MHTLVQINPADETSWKVVFIADGSTLEIFRGLTKHRACELAAWLNGGSPQTLSGYR